VGIEFGERHEIAVEHILGFGPQHISQPAGHTRTKIQTERPENDGHAARHVFTSVLADPFHDGKRAAVSDSETLSAPSCNKELARRGTVEHSVACKDVTTPCGSKSRSDGDGPTGQSMSDVGFGFAVELESHPL